MNNFFKKLTNKVTSFTGSVEAFFLAILITLLWFIIGPFFNFSDTWQLIINTVTSIVTFVMVFIIQNSQNRNTEAIHLKLDELINSIDKASKDLIDIEELSEEELEKEKESLRKIKKATAKNKI